jgi:hypothetical protein
MSPRKKEEMKLTQMWVLASCVHTVTLPPIADEQKCWRTHLDAAMFLGEREYPRKNSEIS